jgi:hypothetical protein
MEKKRTRVGDNIGKKIFSDKKIMDFVKLKLRDGNKEWYLKYKRLLVF